MKLGKCACYQVEGSLTIANRRNLLLEGSGATRQGDDEGDEVRVQISIDNSENIIVRNLTVKGANPLAGATRAAYDEALEARHGFSLGGVRHVLFDNVQASDVYGDFVSLSSSAGRQPRAGSRGQASEQVAVVRSRFHRSGRQGIAITSARDVTIRGNVTADVARSIVRPGAQHRGQHRAGHADRAEHNRGGRQLWIASKGAGNQIGGNVPMYALRNEFGYAPDRRGASTVRDGRDLNARSPSSGR